MSGKAQTTLLNVGASQQPVVIMDDFHPDADGLRATARSLAKQSAFRSLSPFYPGVQAPADPTHLAPVSERLAQVLADAFGVTQGLHIVQCSFSLVTTPDSALTPIQRLPHVDTTDPGRLALLHYLSDEDTGGTAFYRHRKTGREILTEDTFEHYKQALEAEGLPKSGYMRGSDDRFEMIGSVEARPNRAILYRSHLLHSGLIPAAHPLPEDPETGRLTLNSFFQIRS